MLRGNSENSMRVHSSCQSLSHASSSLGRPVALRVAASGKRTRPLSPSGLISQTSLSLHLIILMLTHPVAATMLDPGLLVFLLVCTVFLWSMTGSR